MKQQIITRLELIERRIHDIAQARLDPDKLSASLLSITAEELKQLAAELDGGADG